MLPIIALMLSMFAVNPASTQTTELFVFPPWSSTSPFSITIIIADVIELAGYEFKLEFDPSLLQATPPIVVGDFFPTSYVWKNTIDNVNGIAWLGVTRPLGTPDPGVSGSGILAIINFNVIGSGSCYLDLYDTKLGDPGGSAIAHNVHDGYFANIDTTFEANLIRRSAWPEHHHFVEAKDEDHAQTLFGKVRNLGNAVTKVKVIFTIYDEYGFEFDSPETPTATLQPGEIRNLEVIWTGFDIPAKYSVEARAWYDTDGDTIPDTPGVKIKSFGFAVV